VLDIRGAATGIGLSFEQADIDAAFGKYGGGGQPANASADDDDFVFHLVKAD
jgi:hypothetical protein